MENREGAGGYFFVPDKRVVDIAEDNPPQYINIDQLPMAIVAEGLGLKPIYGQNMLLSFVYMKPHSVAALQLRGIRSPIDTTKDSA